jgi:hypothetical protein
VDSTGEVCGSWTLDFHKNLDDVGLDAKSGFRSKPQEVISLRGGGGLTTPPGRGRPVRLGAYMRIYACLHICGQAKARALWGAGQVTRAALLSVYYLQGNIGRAPVRVCCTIAAV